jgi:hypothetical protein
MEHKSYVTDDSESHNAAPLFIKNCQEHQAQDSYLYIFLDIFSFPLTTCDGCLDTLPIVVTRVIMTQTHGPKFRVPKQYLKRAVVIAVSDGLGWAQPWPEL